MSKPATLTPWLGAEDMLRLALGAYYAVCRKRAAWYAANPDGLAEDLATGAGHLELAEDLTYFLTLRLEDFAFRKGVKGFDSRSTDHLRQHAEYFGYVDNSSQNTR